MIVFVIGTQWRAFSTQSCLLGFRAGITYSFDGRGRGLIGGFTVFCFSTSKKDDDDIEKRIRIFRSASNCVAATSVQDDVHFS